MTECTITRLSNYTKRGFSESSSPQTVRIPRLVPPPTHFSLWLHITAARDFEFERSRNACIQTSPLHSVLHAVRGAPMGDCDGRLVPRPAHTAGPSHEEGALAWTLIIVSGHITFVRGWAPAAVIYTDLCNGALRVDAKDHLSGPVQHLDTHPGKQRLSRRCSRW